jgi:hypothetical protein
MTWPEHIHMGSTSKRQGRPTSHDTDHARWITGDETRRTPRVRAWGRPRCRGRSGSSREGWGNMAASTPRSRGQPCCPAPPTLPSPRAGRPERRGEAGTRGGCRSPLPRSRATAAGVHLQQFSGQRFQDRMKDRRPLVLIRVALRRRRATNGKIFRKKATNGK